MNLAMPVQGLRRQVQSPTCGNSRCPLGQWSRWCRRNDGVQFNGRWYCSHECLNPAMEGFLRIAPHSRVEPRESYHRLPLGLLLLSRGVLEESQLTAALAMQAESPEKKIGECLQRLGLATEEEITRAVAMQNCVPVMLGYDPLADYVLPLRLQEVSQAFCFRSTANSATAYLGFASRVDRGLVSAIDWVLGVRVEPCIIPGRVIAEKHASLQDRRDQAELVFEVRMPDTEMVRAICSYARQADAGRIRVATTSHYAWARLECAQQNLDLVFRLR